MYRVLHLHTTKMETNDDDTNYFRTKEVAEVTEIPLELCKEPFLLMKVGTVSGIPNVGLGDAKRGIIDEGHPNFTIGKTSTVCCPGADWKPWNITPTKIFSSDEENVFIIHTKRSKYAFSAFFQPKEKERDTGSTDLPHGPRKTADGARIRFWNSIGGQPKN